MLPRALIATLFLFLLVTVVTALRYDGSPVRDRDAPAELFSAARAHDILRALVGEGKPHPVGSEEGARVRSQIVTELERLGYAPEVQATFACGKHGACGFVQNVVARLPGREAGPSVLLAAHYDSVGASPGANDDGSGVASVLEIARALQAGPPPRHTVILLLDEGEEAGLLGAEGFAREHPAMRDVRAAVNLDARGSSGPSVMFETSPQNRWIVDLMATSLRRPVSSSLYYAIYQRMPNDTDLTVWKRTAHGANFAFTGSIEHYHTPLDRLQNTRLGTLQQQGENGLAMTRAFAEADIAHPPPGDAVWFDVLAAFVVRWPEPCTLPLAISALLLTALGIVLRAREGTVRASSLLLGVFAVPLTVVAGACVAGAAGVVLRAAGALPAPWSANGTALEGALWALSAAVCATFGAALARGADGPTLAGGVWLGWALVGVVMASILPGASFLFVVPALAFGLAGLRSPVKMGPAAVAAISASVVWIPVLWLLYAGIGVAVPAAHGGVVSALLTTLLPFCATVPQGWRTKIPALAGAGALVATVAAFVRPAFSAKEPQRVNLVFHQDDGALDARWLVDPSWGGTAWGDPPDAMRRALGPGARDEARFAWSPQLAAVGHTPRINAPPPELAVLGTTTAGATRLVHARLASQRGARTLLLVFPPGSRGVVLRAHGVPVLGARPLSSNGWRAYSFFAVPAEGVELDIAIDGEPAEVTVLDQGPGVPASGDALLAARPATAAPTQDGDVTIVTRRQLL